MAFPFGILNRLFARRDPEPVQTRALEAASLRRPWGAPVGEGIGNATIATGLTTVRQRSRHASVNNPWLGNGVAAIVAALVGAGITATPTIPAADARAAVVAAADRWAAVADADGVTDWYGLQSAVARAVVVDGEAFAHLLATDAGLRVRLLSAEQVDFSLTRELEGGGRIVNGIEFAADGSRTAYHVLRYNGPLNLSIAPPIRVPASEISHVFKPLFAGQVRGIPWAAPVLLTLNEIDQLQDALLMGAKIAAMHAGFLIDQNVTGGIPYEGDQQGSILTGGLEPGTLKRLPAGFDIKFSTPQQIRTGVDLAKLNLRSIAAGLGVPEYLLTGDLSQANYSSLRAALVEFRRRTEQVQYHYVIPQLLRPVWRRWAMLEILSGRIDAPGDDLESWLGVEFYPPAFPWVDPENDAKAERELIAAGLKSRRQAVAERGYSVEQLDTEIAADREREARLGLNFGAPTNA